MTPLDVSEGKLRVHWNKLSSQLRELSYQGFSPAELIPQFAGQTAFATFRSELLHRIERQRGFALAVPLGRSSRRGAPYWVSFLEEWEVLSASSFRFRSCNLTFFQQVSSERTVQLFRAEWPGVRDWGSGSPGFQAPGAAHPHWQFDALAEFVSEEARRAEAARIAEALGHGDEVSEFGDDDVAALNELAFGELVDLDWTRMHYACQAKWSEVPWTGPQSDVGAHAASPPGLANIRNWVVSALAYSIDQLT